jgi:aspartate aminotransferase
MKKITPSATVTINTLALQKKRAGERIFSFAAADPVLPNHEAITKAALKATEKRYVPYPPIAGIPELRKAAAEWASYPVENTLVTCGGKYALFAAIQTLLEPGDEVLIPAPYWVSYPEIVRIFSGVPKIVPAQWKVTPQDLQKHVTKKTKILILNSACNPTGVLYSREEIEKILAFCKQENLTIISDEVYSKMVYEGSFASCGDFPEHRDRVIIIQSCSKNFGMTGWRVGFAFAPKQILDVMTALQGQSTTGTCLVSQWAAVGALEQADAVVEYVKSAMRTRRDLFVKTYNELFPLKIESPPSAIYAWAPIAEKDSVKFCERAMQEANVAIVPGIAFGVEGYIRFAFSGVEEEIVGGLNALRKIL